MPKFVYPETCLKCGDVLSRSRRYGLLERLLRLFNVAVFRCHRCLSRYYAVPAIISRAPEHESRRNHGRKPGEDDPLEYLGRELHLDQPDQVIPRTDPVEQRR
jgi:hypothetical protein